MVCELKLGEDADRDIRRIIVEEIDETVQVLTATPDGSHQAVHSTRKSAKRIRATLRLLRGALGEETFHLENAYYRDVSRQLADVRDSLVIVYAVEALAGHFQDEVAPGAFDEIRQRLFTRHERISQQILADGRALVKTAEALQSGRERVLSWRLDGNGFDLFAAGLARVYRRGRRQMMRAYATGDAALFHDWRKRVKDLWYQLEILRPIWPTHIDSLVVDLKQVSDYLGDAHDLVALGQVLVDEPELVAEDPALPHLLALIERWQDDFETAARPLGMRLYLETPGQFLAAMDRYWQLWCGGEAISPGPSLAAIRAESVLAEGRTTASLTSGPAGEYLTTGEAAEQLGLTVGRVRHLIRQGQLPAEKIGSFWVIHEGDLPLSAGGLNARG